MERHVLLCSIFVSSHEMCEFKRRCNSPRHRQTAASGGLRWPPFLQLFAVISTSFVTLGFLRGISHRTAPLPPPMPCCECVLGGDSRCLHNHADAGGLKGLGDRHGDLFGQPLLNCGHRKTWTNRGSEQTADGPEVQQLLQQTGLQEAVRKADGKSNIRWREHLLKPNLCALSCIPLFWRKRDGFFWDVQSALTDLQ